MFVHFSLKCTYKLGKRIQCSFGVKDVAGISQELQRATHYSGRSGITMFALSGVDIALWDIAGKATGQPLFELFGGARRKQIPTYAHIRSRLTRESAPSRNHARRVSG